MNRIISVKQNQKLLFLLILLVFLLYGNSIKNNYALDDDYVTVTNPRNLQNHRIAKGIRGIKHIFTSHYIETKQQSFEYRPLTLTTFAVEYEFFGSNPHISHLINLLLYALTNCILFLILARLFKDHHIIVPLLITILFLAHPIHTEVVSNIKSRDELLSFLFGLCSFLFILKNRETKKKPYLVFSFLFVFMSLLCKKTGVLFIAFTPLTLYFFSLAKPRQITGFLILTFSAYLSYLLLKEGLTDESTTNRAYAFFENPLFYEPHFANRIPTAFYTIGYYFKLLIVPYPLSCYYGYSCIPFIEWTTPLVIISIIVCALILIYVIKTFSRKHFLSYALIICLTGIFPFSNLIALATGVVADRYIYFASLGFCMFTGYLLLYIFNITTSKYVAIKMQRLNPLFLISTGSILLFYGGITISRNQDWKDELTLFRKDTENFENSCNLHYITGNTLYNEIIKLPNGPAREALITEAKTHFRKAVVLMQEGVKKYPEDYTTLNNIGTIYMNVFNDPVTAQPFFRRSAGLNPKDMVAAYNNAYCYERRHLTDSAITMYEAITRENNPYPPVYIQLRALYLSKKNYDKTIWCDLKNIGNYPDQAEQRVNLGNDYLLNKDTLKGIEQFELALKIEPGNAGLRSQIVSFLKSTGHNKKASELEKKY